MTHLRLLAIETSSAVGSVALGTGSAVHEREIATPREQTARVIRLVDELLAAEDLALTDLDALVLGRGPGSFTGLRVAAGVLQGLSLAAGVPVVAVSSLAALACRALAACPDVPRALCLVDARMGEVYCGDYIRSDTLVTEAAAETLCRPEAVTLPAGHWLAAGDALIAYAGLRDAVRDVAAELQPALYPRAQDLLPLAAREYAAGRLLAVGQVLPVYLREADAWHRN